MLGFCLFINEVASTCNETLECTTSERKVGVCFDGKCLTTIPSITKEHLGFIIKVQYPQNKLNVSLNIFYQMFVNLCIHTSNNFGQIEHDEMSDILLILQYIFYQTKKFNEKWSPYFHTLTIARDPRKYIFASNMQNGFHDTN